MLVFFAFAIYWALWNVGSSKDIPIISLQTSILYIHMGVTYLYMGIPTVSEWIRNAHIFFVLFLLAFADAPEIQHAGITYTALRQLVNTKRNSI